MINPTKAQERFPKHYASGLQYGNDLPCSRSRVVQLIDAILGEKHLQTVTIGTPAPTSGYTMAMTQNSNEVSENDVIVGIEFPWLCS